MQFSKLKTCMHEGKTAINNGKVSGTSKALELPSEHILKQTIKFSQKIYTRDNWCVHCSQMSLMRLFLLIHWLEPESNTTWVAHQSMTVGWSPRNGEFFSIATMFMLVGRDTWSHRGSRDKIFPHSHVYLFKHECWEARVTMWPTLPWVWHTWVGKENVPLWIWMISCNFGMGLMPTSHKRIFPREKLAARKLVKKTGLHTSGKLPSGSSSGRWCQLIWLWWKT